MPDETSLHLILAAQDQGLGAEQDQLPCQSTGTSSGNCQEMEHDSLSKTVFQGTLKVGGTVEEILVRQHQDWSGRGSLLSHPSCPPSDPISQGTEMN